MSDVQEAKERLEKTIIRNKIMNNCTIAYIPALQTILQDHTRLEEEVKKENPYIKEFMKLCNHKDKVIQLMAEELMKLREHEPYSIKSYDELKKDIIKYFENKAKESE